MNTLLFLFTLVGNSHCIAWLSNSGNYDFSQYQNIVNVQVFDQNALSDTMADILFSNIYIVDGITVQCEN